MPSRHLMPSRHPSQPNVTLAKAILFALSLLPLSRLAWAAYTGDFGPNPVEFIQRWTGTWTINFLFLTLCVTPLRVIMRQPWLGRLRRMLGLFCFFYATLHLLTFVGFDHDFDLSDMARDIVKRPFITVGFATYLLLIPLAATSNQWMIRKLGGRRWQELHRSIYPIGILACIHYLWLVKATALLWPIGYGIGLAILLGWRIQDRLKRAIPVKRPPATAEVKFFRQMPK